MKEQSNTDTDQYFIPQGPEIILILLSEVNMNFKNYIEIGTLYVSFYYIIFNTIILH